MISKNTRPDIGNSANLLIVGRYKANYDVMLEGSSQALHDLASFIDSGSSPLICALRVPSHASPTPYGNFLTSIQIIRKAGAVQLRREGDVLVICGAAENMNIIAQGIRNLADSTQPSEGVAPHLQIEYYPDHPYLALSLFPLIIVATGAKLGG